MEKTTKEEVLQVNAMDDFLKWMWRNVDRNTSEHIREINIGKLWHDGQGNHFSTADLISIYNEETGNQLQTVNERQKILDSNREMLTALESYMDYQKQFFGEWMVALRPLTNQIKTAINNAKSNIKP